MGVCVYWPFHLSEVHHVVDGAGLTHHVEPPQACVSVAGVEGLEAVAQVALTGHLSQFTGQILESEDTIQQGRLQDGGMTLYYHVQTAVLCLLTITLTIYILFALLNGQSQELVHVAGYRY